MVPGDSQQDSRDSAVPDRTVCPSCGDTCPDWVSRCAGCGGIVMAPEQAMRAETGHIRYLLHEMANWGPRHLLPVRGEEILRAEYSRRRDRLVFRLAGGRSEANSEAESGVDVVGAPPVVPDIPVSSRSGRTEATAPERATSEAPPALTASGSSASSSDRSRPSAPRRPILRDFVEEHALKIVFGLATVLVLVALRTMVGWDWLGPLVMRAIPMAPLLLTLLFWVFGERTRRDDAWAAVIYHGLAAVLVGFVVVAVNKYWLAGALMVRAVYPVSSAAATVAAAVLVRRYREPAYLHLFQLCAFSSLYGILTLLRPGGPLDDFRPLPLSLFSGGYLVYGALCLAAASRIRETDGADRARGAVRPGIGRGEMVTWAHLSVTAAVSLATVGKVLSESPGMNDLAALALATGLIYVFGAQWLANPEMVYAAGVAVGSGILLWLSTPGLKVWPSSVLGVALLASASLGMAELNTRRAASDGRVEIVGAYQVVARLAAVVATVLLWCGAAASLIGPTGPGIAREALTGALLALWVGGLNFLLARRDERAGYAYGAILAWAVVVIDMLIGMRAPGGGFALALVLYGSALCAAAESLARARPMLARPDRLASVQTNALLVHLGWPASVWSEPLMRSGYASAAAGTFFAVVLPSSGDAAASVHWGPAALTLTLACALYAVLAQRKGSPLFAYSALGCAAYASELLFWRLAPARSSLAEWLAPFLVAASAAALALSLRRSTLAAPPLGAPGSAPTGNPADDTPSDTSADNTGVSPVDAKAQGIGMIVRPDWRRLALWREPVAVAGVVVGAVVLFDAGILCLGGAPARTWVPALPGLLVASALLTIARRSADRDNLRAAALTLGSVTTALVAGAACGLTGDPEKWPIAGIRLAAVSLSAVSWGWWAAGRSLYRLPFRRRIGGELNIVGLATALVSSATLALAAFAAPAPSIALFAAVEVSVAAGFALYCIEAARFREEGLVNASLVVAGCAVVANAGLAPVGAPIHSLYALLVLLIAGAYFALAQRLGSLTAARLAAMVMAVGYAGYLLRLGGTTLSGTDGAADAIWAVGGVGLGWACLRSAIRGQSTDLGYAAALTWIGVTMHCLTRMAHVPGAWHALWLAPGLAAMYVVGWRAAPRSAALIGQPLRRVALLASVVVQLWSVAAAEGAFGPVCAVSPSASALTPAVFGAAYALLAVFATTPAAVVRSAVLMVVGYLWEICRRPDAPLSGVNEVDQVIWAVGGLVIGWAFLRTAMANDRGDFGSAAAVTWLAGYLHLLVRLGHLSSHWHALFLLPALAATYLVGNRMADGRKTSVGASFQRTALKTAGFALIWSVCSADGLFLLFQLSAPSAATMTLAVFGTVYALLAVQMRTRTTVTTAGRTLTAAYMQYLLTRTPLLSANERVWLSWSLVAFLAIQAAVVLAAASWRLRRSAETAELAEPLLNLAALVAAGTALFAVATVQTPHQGSWTILTLAWGGAIWVGLGLMGRGDGCVHVGAWNLIMAWILIMYNRFGAEMTLLDVYLIPIGIYLLVVGHVLSGRRAQQNAQPFWWAGLMVLMTPAFLAHWEHAPLWHTPLLLVECLVAIVWGIAQKIRAFMLCGAGFAAAYAAAAVVGRTPDVVGTLVSLFMGVALFVLGYYALKHRDRIPLWEAAVDRQLSAWRAWR